MYLLERALALFEEHDINIDTARELYLLEQMAEGEEFFKIVRLWEDFSNRAEEEVFLQAWNEGLI